MQVLADGRSVYLPPFSSVSWEDIPLHITDIERIEVVRGPVAASYGANSVQGVINIITRDASNVDGTRVSATKGNGGISDVSAHLGKVGTELDYQFTLGYRADNGFDTNMKVMLPAWLICVPTLRPNQNQTPPSRCRSNPVSVMKCPR